MEYSDKTTNDTNTITANTPISMHRLVHPSREVTLPNGTTLRVCKLRNENWAPALVQFGNFLEAMTILLDRDVTEHDLIAEMPAVLMDTFNNPMGRDAVAGFFAYFVDGELSAESVDAWAYDDFETAWQEVWRDNARPFALRLTQLMRLDAMRKTRDQWGVMQDALMEAEGEEVAGSAEATVILSDSLPAQE